MNAFFLALVILGVAECGGSEMKRPRKPEPPFLSNMNREAKNEYHDILRNKGETIAAQKQQVMAWARRHGIEAEVQEFEAKRSKHREELRANVTALLAALPQAYQRLTEIMNNENQTPIQLKEAMDQFKKSGKNEYEMLMFASFASGQFPQFRVRPQGGSIEAQVQEFEAKISKHSEELRAKVTALLAALPQAYQRLTKIMDNENQTPIQLKEAMDQFKNSAKNEYEMLMFASGRFPQFRVGPQRGGPRGRWHKSRRHY
ncbi:hypothetical protein Y032_0233g3095 [Ancylostoma ceylanicum]|uniref:SXP/RAL-2 family protein Ani s 5-like cation-binding domain-containing protein n=1 Tax=Ancylostoma ceylanicum TaxID=53326 RepID=A0A016SFZ4_9BILA|nr:hypothetical protein Y032_0233g3095 [Ancylostoma ceylanicum]